MTVQIERLMVLLEFIIMLRGADSPKSSLTDLVGPLDDKTADELEGILEGLRRDRDVEFSRGITEIANILNERTA